MTVMRQTAGPHGSASAGRLADGEMVWIPGGTFRMGSDDAYPEEAPEHRATVEGVWLDPAPVTNARFGAFVAATGHCTTAETAPSLDDHPDADTELLVPGSLVFDPPGTPVAHDDPATWWAYVPGANWRHPSGPGSSLEGLDNHPVVHISFTDALAYARWAGKRLPTESEWERAAWGGQRLGPYAWGDALTSNGTPMANHWHGEFPWQNTSPDGWERTSPVGTYPPNSYGLVDMIGNVWEWTASPWRPQHGPRQSCCPATAGRAWTIKGGSHLCAESYCRRYRPSARSSQTVDASTSHLGFRCARSGQPTDAES